MDGTIIVALCSLAGTLGGSLLGAISSSRLTAYRIEQLERKVEVHNNVIERVTILEHEDTHIKRDVNKLFEMARRMETEIAQK